MEQPADCPCCLFLTNPEGHAYQICPVCYWEDCGERNLDERSGPNHMTLRQGRANYNHFGACDLNMVKHVRKPLPHEIPQMSPMTAGAVRRPNWTGLEGDIRLAEEKIDQYLQGQGPGTVRLGVALAAIRRVLLALEAQ